MVGFVVGVIVGRIAPVLQHRLHVEGVRFVAAIRCKAAMALAPVGVEGAGGGGGGGGDDDGGEAALGHAVGAVAHGEILHGGGAAEEMDSRVLGVLMVWKREWG